MNIGKETRGYFQFGSNYIQEDTALILNWCQEALILLMTAGWTLIFLLDNDLITSVLKKIDCNSK
jgi:hypothetical protein